MAKLKSVEQKILEAIPYVEGCTFGEFCQDFEDTPERGDREGCSALFREIERLGSKVEIERDNGRIASMKLTDEGKMRLKELLEKAF